MEICSQYSPGMSDPQGDFLTLVGEHTARHYQLDSGLSSFLREQGATDSPDQRELLKTQLKVMADCIRRLSVLFNNDVVLENAASDLENAAEGAPEFPDLAGPPEWLGQVSEIERNVHTLAYHILRDHSSVERNREYIIALHQLEKDASFVGRGTRSYSSVQHSWNQAM